MTAAASISLLTLALIVARAATIMVQQVAPMLVLMPVVSVRTAGAPHTFSFHLALIPAQLTSGVCGCW